MKTVSKNGVLVLLLVLAPIVVAVAISVLGRRWFPAGDMAQAELHMRGFFARPPLVGAAGRIVSDSGFQGSHPGPSLWVAMLPVYLLGGRSSDALMAAAASVHVASIVAILLLSLRRFGRAGAIAMAFALVAVVRSSGTDFMIEPWNPWLALLPFAVFVLLIMELASPSSGDVRAGVIRERWTLVLAVVVGSHCVQSHAGYALLVLPPLAITVIRIVWRGGRGTHARKLVDRENPGSGACSVVSDRLTSALVTTAWAGAVTGLMWLPVFVDQIRRKPGNLTILLQHFGSPEEPTLGFLESMDIVVAQLNLFGPWVFGPGADQGALTWLGFVAFLVLAVAAFLLSRNRVMRTSLATLGGFIVLGTMSILRIFGPFYEYTVRWLWLLAASTVALSLAALFDRARDRWAQVSRHSIRTALVGLVWSGLVASSAVTVWQVVDRVKLPGETDSRILAGLIDETEKRLDPSKTYQVRFYDPYTLNATGFGLVLELERRGFEVKVDPEFAAAALPHRTAPMKETDEILWVVVGPALERALDDPALTVLATFNPRTEEQQVRSTELLEEVKTGLLEAGRADLVASLDSPGASILFTDPPLPDATAELVRELIRMGQPTGVFSMAVTDIATSLG